VQLLEGEGLDKFQIVWGQFIDSVSEQLGDADASTESA
jgi:hypothetical protein